MLRQATVSERTARAEEAARLAAEEAAAAAQREAEEQEAARKRAQALAEEEADRRRQEELEAEQGEQRRRAEDEARRKRREEVRLQRRLENACTETQTEGRCSGQERNSAKRKHLDRSASQVMAASGGDYSPAQVAAALEMAGGDTQRATVLLLSGKMGHPQAAHH